MPGRRRSAVAARSAEDAAAEARHVGGADGLQQEILGAFLQAPDKAIATKKKQVSKQISSRKEDTTSVLGLWAYKMLTC
jgi:hypothetical protein